MGSPGPVRWGAAGLTLGGAAWLALGLSKAFGYLQAIPGREDVALLVLTLLLTAAGWKGSTPCRGKATGCWDGLAST